MKTVLQYCGIAYLGIGIALMGCRFVRLNGVLGSFFNPTATSDASLGDVVLWPVLVYMGKAL